jgi:hypothetical protein
MDTTHKTLLVLSLLFLIIFGPPLAMISYEFWAPVLGL